MGAAPARFRNWAVSAALLARDLGHIARSRKSEAGPSLNRQFAWMADPKRFAFDVANLTLDDWQVLPLRSKKRKVLGNLARQSGKALHVDTPIPTPSGWTMMGAIEAGDTVFDAAGRPCRVLHTSAVEMRQAYRVKFSDGAEIVADGEHLWTVVGRSMRQSLSRNGEHVPAEWWCWDSRKGVVHPERQCIFEGCAKPKSSGGLCVSHRQQEKQGKVLTPLDSRRGGRCNGDVGATTITTDVMRDGAGQTRTHACGRTSRESQHAIPAHPGLATAQQIATPHKIDPYTLGVWLGDGTSTSGNITSADPEVLDQIRSAGYDLSFCKGASKGSGKATTHRVVGLHRKLRLSGLLGNKHIPADYLRADRETRLALLQGLMDSDGSVGSGNSASVCEFTSTRREIADGAYELATSLGLIVRVTEGRAKLYGKDCGPKWRLFFTPHFHVFRLPRKQKRLRLDSEPLRRRMRFVVSVEPLPEPAPVRCIGIDSDSKLYLAGRAMIPTHNSSAASFAIAHMAIFQPWRRKGDDRPANEHPILVTAPSMRQTKILIRAARNIIRGSRMVNELVTNNVMEIELPNGSRIVGVAAREDTIRGEQAPPFIVIDEASRVADEVWDAISPMMATVAETVRVFAASTPHGQRGWWWKLWENGGDEWERINRTAHDNPRITAEFLASERRRMSPNKFAEEYETLFAATESQPFPPSLLDRIFQSAEGLTPIATPGMVGTVARPTVVPPEPEIIDAIEKLQEERSDGPGWLEDIDWSDLT